MRPDQSIQIQLETSTGEPIALGNALVEIRLFTNGNFRYCFNPGCTDKNGRLRVSYSDLERLRAANAKQFLMDYNTPIEQCDRRVEIRIPSEQELRERQSTVMKSFGKPPEWANNWPSNAQVVTRPKLVELVDPVTRVSIPTRGELGDENLGTDGTFPGF